MHVSQSQTHCTYVAFVSLSDVKLFFLFFFLINIYIHIGPLLYVEFECAPGVLSAVYV